MMRKPGTHVRLALVATWLLLAGLVYCAGLTPGPVLPLFLEFVATVLILYLFLAGAFVWPTYLLVSLCACCFFLILGDGALRVLLANSLYYRPHEKLFEKSPLYPLSYRYQPGQTLSQNAIGDLANFTCGQSIVEPRMVLFQTDEYGFRNDMYPAKTDFELIVLGDSFGVANGTSQEKTWWHLLSRHPGRDLYNLSLPSAPRQEVAVLTRELPRLKLATQPVVIWQLFEGNDLLDSPPPSDPHQRHGWIGAIHARLTNYQRRSPVMLLLNSLGSECGTASKVEQLEVSPMGPMLFYTDYYQDRSFSAEQIAAMPGWNFMQEAFKSMAELRQRYGFAVLIVLIPTKQQVYLSEWADGGVSPLARLIEKESGKYSFRFLALQPLFQSEAEESTEPLYWRDDTHLSNAGNAFLAQLLENELREMGASDAARRANPE